MIDPLHMCDKSSTVNMAAIQEKCDYNLSWQL